MSASNLDTETQSDKLLLRLKPSEKSAFAVAASIAGISVTAWMRERLRLSAARELEAAGQKIPFLKDLTID